MLDPGNLPGDTASLDFGEQTQFEGERKAIESAGSRTPTPAQLGARATQAGPAPAVASQGPMPSPSQPAPQPPRQPLTQADLQPGGKVFSQPQMLPTRPWRQDLRIMAAHPKAGPFLGALVRKMDTEEAATGKFTTARTQGQP